MNPLEQIARAALSGDALETRSLVQDWLATEPVIAKVPAPSELDQTLMSLLAAFAELFAARLGQIPPSWTAEIGPAPLPVHLVRSTLRMPRLRAMCEAESPLPLRHRNFYAPSNYLQAV